MSDRQAAGAVRGRPDWKYCLSLELTDPGFDASVLSEFRTRLVAGNGAERLLGRLLEVSRERRLPAGGGRQRTDSTHALAAVRALGNAELVLETVRAALEALAVAAPDWPATVVEAPGGAGGGLVPCAPWLRQVPAVDVPRRVWVQRFRTSGSPQIIVHVASTEAALSDVESVTGRHQDLGQEGLSPDRRGPYQRRSRPDGGRARD